MRDRLIPLLLLAACTGDKTTTTTSPCETWHTDADADGYGDPGLPVTVCEPADEAGAVPNSLDCDDSDATISPEGVEVCDLEDRDEDCDGLADDDDDDAIGGLDTWPDADDDGFGDPGGQVEPYCGLPPGRSRAPTDCDDGDAATYPGVAAEDPNACMTDADADGFGDDSPASGVTPGTDCDDGDDTILPGAIEGFGDGIDDDCDGADLWLLADGFELGTPDPLVWAAQASITLLDSGVGDPVATGTHALLLDGAGGTIESITVDASACPSITWSYQGLRLIDGPVGLETLSLQHHDGTGWVDLDVWAGGLVEPGFELRSGEISAASALHPALRFRFLADGASSEDFVIDDVRIACPGDDADGDGLGTNEDCDDGDADHWSDCGLCTDVDGDDFGADCDLGPDCDDADDTTFPGAPDPIGDGADTDCNGVDGPGLFDDFELGAPDPFAWAELQGDYAYDDTLAASGSYSLNLGGGGAIATARPIDASVCSDLGIVAWVRRGPDAPEPGEALILSWHDGTAWVPALTVEGNSEPDPDFLLYQATLDDSAAMIAELALRLEHSGGSGEGTDDFYVDDLAVACDQGDSDGDGVVALIDCDDADAAHWSDCGLCTDVDGDDRGPGCDLGDDCDDDDATTYPGADDPLGDGIDQDCNGLDGQGLFDDFELGSPDPVVWDEISGDFTYAVGVSVSGTTSLDLDGGAVATSQPVDLSGCDSALWRYQVKRGPDAPEVTDSLVLEWHDGTTWIEADRVTGDGTIDAAFAPRSGAITDPAALAAGFVLRLRNTSAFSGDDFYVDDLLLECAPPDGDGDGFVGTADCDDGDADHWSDCGLCTDADGDGRGQGCDLGDDCDDADDTSYPGALDALADGLDTDCNGVDGPGLFDDFELGTPDPLVWIELRGDHAHDSTEAASGSYSLNLGGGGAVATSVRADLSVCGSVEWRYQVKRGPDAPEPGDDLVLEWYDGATWLEADRVAGDGTTDAAFAPRSGVITDPAAFHPSFQLRLATDILGIAGTDDFYVDDLEISCGGIDADGDGIPSTFDCDDGDADHWSDCGLCVDGDGDGYGPSCDLGLDCNDADPGIHPGVASDPAGDGIDADCDLLDGPGIADDFEAGTVDGAVWASMTGDYAYVTDPVYAGTYALNLTGPAGVAQSVPFDTSSCTEIVWSYQGKRGPDAPSFGDDLVLSYDAGSGWIEADRYPGQGVTDAGYSLRWGTITDPAALWTGFRVQLASTGFINDDYYLDQLVVTCSGGDNDGDGVPAGVDCNDADPAHVSDCLVCIDADGDGYGPGCDQGDDCAPSDPGVSPGAADPYGEGVDTNCDGLDGDALFDDFELGEARADVWDYLWPAVAIVNTQSASGDWSMNLDGFVQATSATLDTSSCPAVLWRYQAKRGPGAPATGSNLNLAYWNGSTYVTVDTLAGDYTEDPDFTERFGVITDPAALSATFMVRFDTTAFIANNDFYVDDFVVGCTDADADGDGYPGALDCDPADGAHWADCGLCVDADGDDFGLDCDLGPDCDDGDSGVSPLASDPHGDGIDSNCDGFDGPVLFDDFELGTPDPLVWTPGTGAILVTPAQAWSGSYSLNLDGAATGSVLESQPLDTSSCPAVLWAYETRRGPDAPEPGDDLVLSYDDGTTWVPADTVPGDGTQDVQPELRFGVIDDPAALWSGFRIRVENTALLGGNDHYLDDVTVICTDGDGDSDGVPLELDCDDSDPWHWADCGVCVDVDGDGAGDGCDLGPDCDDNDATTFPGASDPAGDGIDSDCSGIDGVGIVDDFELGTPAPWWADAIGDQAHSGSFSTSGLYSLALGGGGGLIESIVLDTSSCAQISWSVQVKRGPDAPEATDSLVLEYHDGLGWVQAHAVTGDGTTDPLFVLQAGSINDPAALWSGFRVRLRSSGSSSNTDDFYLDDLSIVCP